MKKFTKEVNQTSDDLSVTNVAIFLACFIFENNFTEVCSAKHVLYLLSDKVGESPRTKHMFLSKFRKCQARNFDLKSSEY